MMVTRRCILRVVSSTVSHDGTSPAASRLSSKGVCAAHQCAGCASSAAFSVACMLFAPQPIRDACINTHATLPAWAHSTCCTVGCHQFINNYWDIGRGSRMQKMQPLLRSVVCCVHDQPPCWGFGIGDGGSRSQLWFMCLETLHWGGGTDTAQ